MGTGIKININMTPIGGFHLSNVDWKATVSSSTGFRTVTVDKQDAVRVDDDNYVICVDTAAVGSGKYYITLIVDLPDADFKGGLRREIKTVFTGIKINAR